MRKFLLGTVMAASAAFAMAGAANAAVPVVAVTPGVTDYNSDVLAVPDSKIAWDFDTIFAPGFDFQPVSATFNGSVSDLCRAPTGDGTNYGCVGPGDANNPSTSPSVFTTPELESELSMLVGSPDTYNRLVFLNNGSVVADLTGSQLYGNLPTNGQNIARRVTYYFGAPSFNEVDFYSTTNAFEVDRLAAAVPEPATWGMMLLGFFGMGALVRSKRRSAALSVA